MKSWWKIMKFDTQHGFFKLNVGWAWTDFECVHMEYLTNQMLTLISTNQRAFLGHARLPSFCDTVTGIKLSKSPKSAKFFQKKWIRGDFYYNKNAPPWKKFLCLVTLWIMKGDLAERLQNCHATVYWPLWSHWLG